MTYGTISTDKLVGSSGGTLSPDSGVFRNRIINGAMVIDQRNAGASVTATDSGYTLDRYVAWTSQSAKFTVQQNAGSVTPPVGFKNYLGITVGASANVTVGTGDYFGIAQYLEGFNTADLGFGAAGASTVTLSFWVRSSVTGIFGGTLENSGFNRSYPFSYTISSANTWEQKTITIAGDTSGTWIGATNGVGMRLLFSIGMGSTYTGTANTWASANYLAPTGQTNLIATNSATFYITGVQLEKGSTATSFDYRPYGTELQLCQRYYQLYTANGVNSFMIGVGLAASSTAINRWGFSLNVVMRAAPTLTFTNISAWAGSNTPTASVGTNYSTVNYASADVSTSGLSLASTGCVGEMYMNNTTGSIVLSAEL